MYCISSLIYRDELNETRPELKWGYVWFFLISPPFPFPRPYMCINSASQGYRIGSSTAVTSQCYTDFFLMEQRAVRHIHVKILFTIFELTTQRGWGFEADRLYPVPK